MCGLFSEPLRRRHVRQSHCSYASGLPDDKCLGDDATQFGAIRSLAAQRGGPPNPQVTPVKALVFDMFGTVVDWRTSVTQEVEALAKRKGLTWTARSSPTPGAPATRPSMNRVRTGEMPWTKLDDLHRMILDKILIDFGITGLSEAETDALNRAWHRLRPWPDAVAGLTRLKKRFIIAPLSNGNISLMTDMAKHSGLPWDCILGAELVRHYKPDPEVYQSAADFLDLKTGRGDDGGRASRRPARGEERGLRTAFVTRPLEYGPNGKPDLKADSSVDVSAKDFNDLATQLGA